MIRLFNHYELDRIFTPSTVARLTYVERVELERDFVKFAKIPGMQIVLYGHSGSGKSTIVVNKLRELGIKSITTRCKSDTTLVDLLLTAFDKLNVYYTSESSYKTSFSIKGELKAKYSKIESAISGSGSSENTSTFQRSLPVQLTPQRLAEFMGGAKCYWVIEDFHKVSEIEKQKIADVLKIFVDTANDFPNTKVICIGAVATARELVEFDSNLSTRIAELYTPLLKDIEIKQIVTKGLHLMNIICNKEMVDKIVYYSNNLASVCHQVCYDLCYDLKVFKSKIFSKRFGESAFKNAVSSFVRKNTDTYTKIYDHIASDRDLKEILIGLYKTEKEFVSDKELLAEIKRSYSISKTSYYEKLESLCSVDYKEVVRYDKNSKKYSFSSPFFQTFVKMKVALEKLESKERSLRKRKQFDLMPDFYADDQFLEDYYNELDTYLNRRLNYTRQMLKKMAEIETEKGKRK